MKEVKVDLKDPKHSLPQYSLTGDLLAFLRCGLQYRYHSGSALPPSRPVQFWFGDFIHGMLESSFRLWQRQKYTFPWPMNMTPHREDSVAGRQDNDIGLLGDQIEAALKAQGKVPRSDVVRENGYLRALHAINELGPDLFPLISQAEQKVLSTRELHRIDSSKFISRANMYELHGIIDVLTEIELSSATSSNSIAEAIKKYVKWQEKTYEVVIDYKGARRPNNKHPYWVQGEWQVQTYAWLRSKQTNSRPVIAGVLLYINELFPSEDDISLLKSEIARNETDILPQNGSSDYYQLSTWTKGAQIPELSKEFRFSRAIRVIPVSDSSIQLATSRFDEVVKKIEASADAESLSGSLEGIWQATGEEDSCETCDFRFFCPDRFPRGKSKTLKAPDAP